MFFKEYDVEGLPARAIKEEKARLIARSYKKMGVTAIGIAQRDLAAGGEFLFSLAEEHALPLVATNLLSPSDPKLAPSHRILDWGGNKVGVVSVLPEKTGGLETYRAAPPEESVARALKAMGEVDAVICLSALGARGDKALVEKFPAIKLVVTALDPRGSALPVLYGSSLKVQTTNRGRYLGALDFNSGRLSTGWQVKADRESRTDLLARLEMAKRQLSALYGGKRQAAANLNPSGRKRAAVIRRAVANMEKRLRAPNPQYETRHIALDGKIEEDREIALAARKLAAREARAKSRLKAEKVAPPPPPGGTFHVGTAACRSCHEEAYKVWVKTSHARSYVILSGEERKDLLCTSCHSQKMYKGTSVTTEPVVGCEACHGHGSKHKSSGNIIAKPGKGKCTACHTRHHKEKDFDYREFYERIRCDKQ